MDPTTSHCHSCCTSGGEQPETIPEPVDKGKQRAREPSERTPLLASSSRIIEDHVAPPAHSNRRLWAKLTTVFLISLSICIVGFVLLALLAWSYASRASNLDPQDVISNDLVLSGPDKVDVLNVTDDGGIWVKVHGRIGMDAGKVIGVGSDPEDNILKDIWKAFGRWGVRTLDRVTVNLTTIIVVPEHDQTETLVTLEIPPIELPLTVNPPNDKSWLTPISTTIFIQPTSNSTLILHFLKDAWQHGTISVRAKVNQATIRGGAPEATDWRRRFQGKLSNIRTSVRMKRESPLINFYRSRTEQLSVPSIPGFPHPGDGQFPPVADLVTLKSFKVSTESTKLALRAMATVVDPVPTTFDLSLPSLPFTVAIADIERPNVDPINIASVSTHPFSLTHPNITLFISGDVLPIAAPAFPILSKFVTRYLSSEDNTVVISSPLIPNLHVEATFPSPKPRPRILRNVTIHNMKIKPTGSVFVASGIVEARVVLPPGINLGLDVFRVFPDVLIFDGEVPATATTHPNHKSHNDSAPPEMPLPDPLPERAFGHIKPDDWLPSISTPVDPEDDEGVVYIVTAKVVDVPVEVLPGRQKEFSNFVGKVGVFLCGDFFVLTTLIFRSYLVRREQPQAFSATLPSKLLLKACLCMGQAVRLARLYYLIFRSRAVCTLGRRVCSTRSRGRLSRIFCIE